MTEITQADRDAAAALYELNAIQPWDEEMVARAFARHRLEERAKIVAWLREQDGHGYDAMRADCIEAGEHLK
jgi:hypothetical protein